MKTSEIIKKYRWKFYFTLSLVMVESILAIFFPLFIGFAIDDALNDSYQGAFLLGGLGLLALIFGAGRRFFDSRFYAVVYQDFGLKSVKAIDAKDNSKRTARLNMLKEVVEFFENSLPELIGSVIGLVGVMVIILELNFKIFLGTLILTVLVFLVYAISRKKTLAHNSGYNNELERQVDAVSSDDQGLKNHLGNLMRWNVKLSDLETINFSASWIFLMSFLVISIVIAIQDGVSNYGALFALIMYVFQYIENLVNLPLFYQQWLRLTEIKQRLEKI